MKKIALHKLNQGDYLFSFLGIFCYNDSIESEKKCIGVAGHMTKPFHSVKIIQYER